MPYKRYNKRRTYRRRRGGRGWTGNRSTYNNKHAWYNSGNAVPLAEQALKTAQWVASLVNAESKYDDTTVTNQVVDYNGYVATLCDPAQGTTAITRNGDSIKLQNLTLRMFCYNTTVSDVLRIIVFEDKQNTITTASQMLQATGSALASLSPKNEDNKYDTKILMDKKYTLDTAAVPIRNIETVIPLKFHTHFNASGGAIDTGALKIMAIGTTAPTSTTNITYYSRVTYLDN